MSGLYTRLCSGVLFPLHERLKGHDSVALRRRLEQSQWWPAERIAETQAQRLRAFLIDIGHRVPYYRNLFAECGFDAAAVRGVDDLQRLPLLGKPEIRAHLEQMKADGHGALMRYNTGGSSGEPLIFYIGKARKSHDVAAKWRATRWWGVDIGDAEAVIWGSPIEHGAQDRLRILRDRAFRSTLLPAFEMSPAKLDGFLEWIRRHRPAMLFGYPSALSLIARRAQAASVRLDGLGIRVAFVTSERLYDDQRLLIQQTFGCPVANGYGARDAGFIAHECPSGGMHVSVEDIVIELVGPGGRPVAAGMPGEIVVTHLATEDFPFVRYRTGDIATAADQPCACGRGLPLLSEIHGRTTDFIVAADGSVMHGLALIYVVRDLPGVARFRIVQQSLECTDVELVAGPEFGPTEERRVVAGFKARLGENVDVRIQRVDAIAPEASGKFRYVVSKVSPSAPAEAPVHA